MTYLIRLGDSTFEPPLVLKATDKDGPLQGDGRVFYSIKSINTDSVVFEMDPQTGELTMLRPVSVDDTENGRYDLVVRATDQGKPEPLHTDVNVYVNVGTTRNQKPTFKLPEYDVSLKEDAAPGSQVATVEARDPDGSDGDLRYSIYSGSKDNFVINPVSGIISVAKDAVLDIDENGDRYYLSVHVTDNGEPFKQTGETMVNIVLEDVNNKAPKFNQESYTEYVLENEPKGFMVLNVNASDADRTADLEFDIIEPIIARDKSGSVLENIAAYDFKSAFNIDPRNGHVIINNKLSYSSAAVIILTLEVVDKNAEVGNQTSTAEATFYIQAFNADSPVFPSPWTPSDPTIQIEVDEELPPGSPLFNLTAKDPLTGQLIENYQKLATQSSEYSDLIQVSPFGVLISTQRLDFEQFRTISFSVAAIAGFQGEPRRTEAHITINLRDVNDNAPVFESPVYRAEIKEDVLPLTLVTTVKANDADTGKFGEVVYSLEGEGENHFMVHPTTGHIQVKPGNLGRSNLDRETKSRYSLRVIARDTPEGGLTQKSTSVLVEVTLLDVNDSPPQFSQTRYTSVVPENSPLQTPVVQVSAIDPDEGLNNQVTYDFANPSQLQGMLSINKQTGQVYLQSSLTGRGRKEPYIVTIRALDNGTPQQFMDTDLYITIGDVSRNDGVPEFVSPKVGEVASVSEEAPVDTFVYQCEAYDPDDPNTANGKLVYSFPDDGSIVHQLFKINPNTGLISTLAALDRETRSEFSLTIEVRDLGTPVQQTTRTLQVVVNDIDDHPPKFNRQRNSVPLTMEVLEETKIGIKVGTVAAVDQDEGRNAEIDYAIIDGNNEDIFEIRSEDNIGNLYLRKRLDREEAGLYTLTIRCFKEGNRGLMSRTKPYDRTKLEELQVKIIVLDKDDNNPMFVEHNKTLGVRINSPLYTQLAQVLAVDPDPDSSPVKYTIDSITYFQPRTAKKEVMAKDVFIVDENTGNVQTNRMYGKYNDGYFELVIKASNTPDDDRSDFATLTVFVLQDTDLMKFVFDEDPVKVSRHISEIKNEIEAAFPRELPLSINIYDTEFYSQGGGLDFGRTSSCFQVLKDGGSIALSSVQTLFDPKTIRPDLQEKLDKFRVIKVERCANVKSTYTISWVQICILAIGILIGVIAFIAAVTTCCLYSKYKRRIRRSNIRNAFKIRNNIFAKRILTVID